MIAVLGASGEVGRHAVAALATAGVGPLRLGARDPRAIAVDPAWREVETTAVDATRPEALAAFCRGARLVLNCAGPSYLLGDRVARAALAAGADHVDVLGDDPVAEALRAAGQPATDRTVVLSAGTVPGLSGLLPRHLAAASAAEATAASTLTVHAGGLERATTTVAADILLSLRSGGPDGRPYGQPMARWRLGRREARALRAEEETEVPFFPGRVATHPLLTAELERAATALGLTEASWYNVFPGAQVRALFGTLPTLPVDTEERRAAVVDRVLRASELDLAGRTPFYRLVVALAGPGWRRTAVVRAADSYRMTGAVAALTVRAVLAGRVPPGAHFAAAALDPGEVIAGLTETGAAGVAVYRTEADEAPDGAGGPAGATAGGFEDGAL
ncbi:saccharopine dehydrogenase NADP-binding domain-containing protein [Streptomyces sp. DSM 44915]|uniref:Saccharopine dehydrogenase NADP-binding domain-containing protein n=1 Tax=Streptomyces chisholmiae TaxID=3075540 RepID=A0ABU2JVX4_9ACTN|nr:saccharopine dehydrogenase NADP-binding domain-containing protein [Streptomyces sp. DSM 44915]MDT0269017.1 saccharopine dehydrogenase NADP-binding domain-containing protein [Streptomyces sp. DSM 44915]